MAQKSFNGTVQATNQTPLSTDLVFAVNSLLDIVGSGSVRWDPNREQVGPSGSPGDTDPNAQAGPGTPIGGLYVICAGEFTLVNGGLLGYKVPHVSEIQFVMNDATGEYANNSGSFTVTMRYDESNIVKHHEHGKADVRY
jgi:hypothetical protein